MKKILISLFALGAVFTGARAQGVEGHWGILGGVNTDKFSTVDEFKSIVDSKAVAGWHLGLTAKIDLPLFFSIQPSVLYENKNSVFCVSESSEQAKMKNSYINVPIAVQWGPDLGLIRIFAEATPFVDFLLGGKIDTSKDIALEVKDYLNTVQFGVGVGGGIEIWKFQLRVRYNWSFGTWKDVSTNPMKDWYGQQQGLTASLAFFFK